MSSGVLLSALAIGYLLVLFGVAFYGERRSVYPGNARLRPWIYSLALGVYCTTWTFFGAVGTAVRDGWSYLPIYLGPVLVFLFATPFLERVVAVVRAHNITSIADLISSRFGKSPGLAALVAVIALTAGVPYLALQYKAVGTSLDVLTGSSGAHREWLDDTALYVALLMALFATLFGTRRLDATEHHEGVMLAIAFESVVKLLAFAAVGVFALLHLDGAPRLDQTPLGSAASVFSGDFLATTGLAAVAIFCLPRQFLVGFVECADAADIRKARLVFSGYLVAFTLLVVPIVLAGLGAGLDATHNPDSFVLTLPLERGAYALAVLAFLGGLSAATAMVIVSSIALATMVTNDLVMPTLWRSRWLKPTEDRDIGRLVLWLRRAAILGLALLAYAYHRNTITPASLASIGLLAFAAFAQFAPPILAGLYWRRASRRAVFWGLMTGFAIWVYALLLPNFAAGGLIGPSVLERDGPSDLLWTQVQSWLGLAYLSPPVRGALFAVAGNVFVLVVLSLLARSSLRERMAATAFVRPAVLQAPSRSVGSTRVGDVLTAAERIVGSAAAQAALLEYSAQMRRPPPKPSDPADRGLLQHMERVLAGAIGGSSARLIFTHALSGRGLAAEEVAEMLDETSQELRFSRQLLQATMENVSQGISVADAEGRLVAWNGRYVEMFDYPPGLVEIGTPVAELIRWNALRGEFGDTDPEEQIRKRLALMKSGSSYVIQRKRRTGRVYEIRGQPMPDGGYVTTYTDVTEYKNTEQQLLEAKQTLEQRVSERTRDLSKALAAEAEAKRAAEQANATKTRFVAAASHDLLQPLNAARLFASALTDTPDPRSVGEIAGRIEGSLRAAEEVLDDMLDIARLESGAMRTELTDFALDDLMADLERQFGPIAARRRLKLRVRRTRAYVRSDRVLLRRVLQNLVSNALRYTQRGGVIVACRPRGERLEVQVWDTGPGIAEQHRALIFSEFRGLDHASPWGEKGLGLGLSICDRISRLLQLDLSLRSVVGRGSLFSVRLQPVEAPAPATARAAATAAPASPSSLGGGTVLCIDDEEAILDGMQTLLERWGVRVLRAGTAEEARRQFREHAPEVVLADYRLGEEDCDGLALLQSLHASDGAPARGALITADHATALAERASGLGYKVLRKPVKPAALRALLGALLASARPASSKTALGEA
ncbi:MAG TPA: PAS domain-containing hybrid sensor histidine kinase/response regulator [Steroidobacteraceae bacterium]|nr:PAS domain-containing hybrid sensor histidine kinase/response regulator [Steroidobacteraceae bacterium]